MKKILFVFVAIALVQVIACTKDDKGYDKSKLLGTWTVVKPIISGSINKVFFTNDSLTYSVSDSLTQKLAKTLFKSKYTFDGKEIKYTKEIQGVKTDVVMTIYVLEATKFTGVVAPSYMGVTKKELSEDFEYKK
jgi:hypothetical protein